MIRAVYLDLDNTLFDRQRAVRAYLGAWRRGRGLPEAPGLLDRAMEVDALGYTPRAAFNDWWCAQPGHTQAPEAFFAEFLRGLGSFVGPEPGVRQALERLRRGHELALVSNGSSGNQRRKLEACGLADLFAPERVFISGEMGHAKPAPGFYEVVAARCGHAQEEVVFVGDRPEHDVYGPSLIGWATCWISRGRTFPATLSGPTWTLAHARELEEPPWKTPSQT